jgi:hypothetical protein
VPHVRDPEAVAPAELVPGLLGERLGGDHQRVERQEAASLGPLPDRVGLRGSDHDLGGDPAAPALHHLGAQLFCRGLLVDRDTEPLAGVGEPASQPSGIDASGVRREGPGEDAPGPADEVGTLLGGQEPVVLGPQPESVLGLGPGAEALHLRVGRREVQRALLLVAAVDPLGGDDAADLVDPALGLALGAQDLVPPAGARVARPAAGDAG